MLTQLTIPKAGAVDPGLDYQRLYDLGLQHVRDLARGLWTDHNVHDPGITTLELLCYALTDLSYRASFPVEDLLAADGDNAANMAAQFYTARQILPNRPVTLSDYRKLLIDLPGVRNAWILPQETTYYADDIKGRLLRENPGLPGVRTVGLRGVYRVVVEYTDAITTQAQRDKVHADALERLHANRCLCEDFTGVTGVVRQPFLLCGELEIDPNADAAQIQAEILFRVQQYLAPPVNNYTLAEMLGRSRSDGSPFSVQEIFEGPLLDCGFIDDEELEHADLRTEIRLSDVIRIVMDIQGVRAVRDMVINAEGTQGSLENKWLVAVDAGKQPSLNRDKSRLVFYKRNMPVEPPAARVNAFYDQMVEASRLKQERKIEDDLPIPLGTPRHAGRYRSFQQHFPALYGIGEQGPPSGADQRRKSLALQLKGYLLFFDQLMANYCAQLDHIRDLFSRDPALAHSYFTQAVASLSTIYVGDDDDQKLDKIADMLEADAEDADSATERRNRFLDHLVARFAERFHDYASIMRSAFDAPPEGLVAVKCAFLDRYPQIGAERGLAYNYTLKDAHSLWNSDNVSGLERRLASLLGIRNATRRNLSEISYDIYPEIDSTPGDEFRFRVRHRVTNKILLSSSTHYAKQADAQREMERALSLAQLPASYQRGTTPKNKHYFNVIDETGEVIARRIEYFDTEAQMNAAIDELIDYVTRFANEDGEGMYLIESILLRPESDGDPFLPICPDPDCSDCSGDDPYSYRVHVVLPAYSGRFDRMDFRRFVEEVIREEMPAHVLPKVCWIGKEDMAKLEKAYRDWIEVRAGATQSQRIEKITALATTLFSVKNVYATAQLRECDSPESELKFIVGQTALGSSDAVES